MATNNNQKIIQMLQPTRKGVVEYACDLLAFTHVQAIRGSPSFNALFPYAISILIYNWLIRDMLIANIAPSGFLNSTTVVSEVIVVTLQYMLWKFLLGTKKNKTQPRSQRGFIEDILDISATMGVSNMYLLVKADMGILGPNQTQ